MMKGLDDEWYSAKWGTLSTRVGDLCWNRLRPRLENYQVAKYFLDKVAFDAYTTDLLEEISSRINTETNLWKYALPLLSNTEKLRELLIADTNAQLYLSADEYLPHFKTVLKQFLNNERRGLMVIDKEYSAGKVATWERLNIISMKLLQENNLDSVERYSDEHTKRVADFIRAHHPKDRNLPKTANTVKDYMYEFSPPANTEFFDDSAENGLLKDQSAAEFLPDLEPLLKRCVEERLTDDQRHIVGTLFGLDEGSSTTVVALTAYRMKKIFETDIAAILRECMENKTLGMLDYQFD